jgi:hypothetical protein
MRFQSMNWRLQIVCEGGREVLVNPVGVTETWMDNDLGHIVHKQEKVVNRPFIANQRQTLPLQ